MFRTSIVSKKMLKTYLFSLGILYGLFMIKLLFIRHPWHRWETYSYNLVPFKTISHYVTYHERFNTNILIENLLGNIVLFIPLGLFLPMISKKYMSFKVFLGSVIILLFCVELMQMLTKVGSLDIDDLILNVAGALTGYLFLKAIIKIFFKDRKEYSTRGRHSGRRD